MTRGCAIVSTAHYLSYSQLWLHSKQVVRGLTTGLQFYSTFVGYGHGFLNIMDWNSHSGPQCHNWFTDNSSKDKPLDGRSAGLVLPEQWFQQSGGTLCRISVTLFHSLFIPRIQKSAGSRLLDTAAINLESRTADSNSRWGIVCGCRGATRVFDATNRTTVPFSVFRTRYTTAAQARVDASQNP